MEIAPFVVVTAPSARRSSTSSILRPAVRLFPAPAAYHLLINFARQNHSPPASGLLPTRRPRRVWSGRFDQSIRMPALESLQTIAEAIDVVSELLRDSLPNRAHLVDQGVG